MKEKPVSFSVLDAFGGIGIYDLESEEAGKTGEYKSGVALLQNSSLCSVNKEPIINKRVLGSSPQDEGFLPPEDERIFQTYLKIINELNRDSAHLLYPGSPYIISELLRPGDSLIACELHKEDYTILKKNIHYPVHNIDAYNAIKAFLPPKTSRGLVLLDPAFEVKDEFSKIISALKFIRKRFAAGVVMVWYPIKDRHIVQKFYTELKTTGYSEFLKIEFEVDQAELAMNKCGVIIANPPNIMNQLQLMMHFLCDLIYNEKAKSIVELI